MLPSEEDLQKRMIICNYATIMLYDKQMIGFFSNGSTDFNDMRFHRVAAHYDYTYRNIYKKNIYIYIYIYIHI